jgi:hypothetical protein
MGTSTLSIYHKCPTYRHTWIWTLIISECTYYDALLYVSFSSFPLYPQIYGQVFSAATPIFSTPLLWRSSFTYIASNIELQIFSHTQLYTGWFVNYKTLLYDKCHILSGYVSLFSNSKDYFSVNDPSELMELLIKYFKNRLFWTKGSFCYEVLFQNQIYHIMCLVIILNHNLFNNVYSSF